MAVAPRAVLVHRATLLTELLGRHGTRGQVEFFLRSRGQNLGALDEGHERVEQALREVAGSIPLDWRRATVERADLAGFPFAPDDVVLVVGQDGLVANVAKYLEDQPVLGIDPEPGVNVGVLVTHRPGDVRGALARAAAPPGPAGLPVRRLTMVEAVVDDGQRLRALNEVFLGPATHQTARYRLEPAPGVTERQASSGLVVGTGTGSTGWLASLHGATHSDLTLPAPRDPALAWFVREAWPSPTTGTRLTAGIVTEPGVEVVVESDSLVLFGDGLEADRVQLGWGQRVRIGVSDRTLHLVAAPGR